MPISALVLTLSDEAESREEALRALEADPRLTVGKLQNTQLPVVVDTETMFEGIDLVRTELPEIGGVTYVHVVSVDFSDTDYSQPANQYVPRKKRARGGQS